MIIKILNHSYHENALSIGILTNSNPETSSRDYWIFDMEKAGDSYQCFIASPEDSSDSGIYQFKSGQLNKLHASSFWEWCDIVALDTFTDFPRTKCFCTKL